uniref:Uncharacterized protein n=1 Tax=Setaria viridis TaxID=4556 RepID=A0A4U6VKN9_SETVI|nr:hypothetical protein SEVIR_3G390900v2 [Setaria viridis]
MAGGKPAGLARRRRGRAAGEAEEGVGDPFWPSPWTDGDGRGGAGGGQGGGGSVPSGGAQGRWSRGRCGAPRGRRGGAGSVDEEHRGDDRRGEVRRERGGVQRPARGAGRRRTGAGWRTAGGDQASGVGPGGPTSMRGRAWGGLGEQRQELGARRRGRRGVR